MVNRVALGRKPANAAARWLPLLFITAILAGGMPDPAAADSAVKYMQRVAGELLVAQRQRFGQQFASVIKRRAAIPAISLHALGPMRDAYLRTSGSATTPASLTLWRATPPRKPPNIP